MPKIRIVFDNVVDRVTLAASSTAGLLAVTNLQTDVKSDVWRSGAGVTSATITGTTSSTEVAACVHFPACNLSPTATIRVRLYSDTAGTSLVYDSSALLACPAPARTPKGWPAALAASAYSNGGGAHARIWFAAISWRRIVVDIVDVNNLQGYIEAARMVVGPYWSPVYNAGSASQGVIDRTQTYLTDAGDELAIVGTIRRTLAIEMSSMPPADRAVVASALLSSRAYPILLSLYPEDPDLLLERDNAIWGRRTRDSDLAVQNAVVYGTAIDIAEF